MCIDKKLHKIMWLLKAYRIVPILLCALLEAATVMPRGALAQSAFPARPLRIITPNAAGGSSDLIARLLAPRLAEDWGQQVVVDNRPGGNGYIGGEALARAPADGHTLMLISPTHIITPLLIPAPYDPVNGFTPIAAIGSTDFLLALHPAVPAATLQQLIALSQAKPGQLNYASAGGGSPAHLASALFNMITGVGMQHVPYKGGGPALTALISGEVQLYFAIPITAIPHVKNGRLKALAVGSPVRMQALPQVPTFAEAGVPAFDIRIWYGLLAPPATPHPRVDALSAAVARQVAAPAFADKLAEQAMTTLKLPPGMFAARMRTDAATYAQVIKRANIRAD